MNCYNSIITVKFCFNIIIRLYMIICIDAIAVKRLPYHRIHLPVTDKFDILVTFVFNSEQAGISIKSDALSGKKLSDASIYGKIFGCTDLDSVYLIYQPCLIRYLQGQFYVMRRHKDSLICFTTQCMKQLHK